MGCNPSAQSPDRGVGPHMMLRLRCGSSLTNCTRHSVRTPLLPGALLLLLLSFLSLSESFLVPVPPALRTSRALQSCPKSHSAATPRHRLRLQMSSSDEEDSSVKANAEMQDAEWMQLDLSERKIKASELRKEAEELETSSAQLRKDAVKREQQAAKLRIRAWTLEGSVSAVTKEINIGNKYERQLAELDIMAEDWIDTDEEKWDWYQKQREMIMEMIESQKYYDKQADEQIQDLKEVLSEVATLLNVETIDSKGDITSTGYGFVLLSVVIPIFIGYEIFQFLSTSSSAFFNGIAGSKDPFDSL